MLFLPRMEWSPTQPYSSGPPLGSERWHDMSICVPPSATWDAWCNRGSIKGMFLSITIFLKIYIFWIISKHICLTVCSRRASLPHFSGAMWLGGIGEPLGSTVLCLQDQLADLSCPGCSPDCHRLSENMHLKALCSHDCGNPHQRQASVCSYTSQLKNRVFSQGPIIGHRGL